MKEAIRTFVEGDEPYQVQISVISISDDLVVIVGGGEKPHVGAVAVSVPRPSLADSEEVSSSTSVFTLTGHKEDDLAKMLAGKIAAALQKNVVLTAGIHVDDIPEEGIKKVQNNCRNALEQLIEDFSSSFEQERRA